VEGEVDFWILSALPFVGCAFHDAYLQDILRELSLDVSDVPARAEPRQLLDRGRWWWLVMDRCYCNPGHPSLRIRRCFREFIEARRVGS
jgi:hypothetical protein